MIALSSKHQKGSKRKRLVPLLSFILLFLLCALPLQPALCMRHGGNIRLALPLRAGEQFSIRYTHSANRSPVVDTLQWEGGEDMIVRSSLFQTYGAGIPADADGRGRTVITAEGILLTEIDSPLKEITLRTGTIADHHIQYREKDIQLKAIVGERQRVTFSIRNLSILTLLLRAPPPQRRAND